MDKIIFKPGDKCRVRTWDDMKNEYGLDALGNVNTPLCEFAPEMAFLCGKTFTVQRIVLVTTDDYDPSEDFYTYKFETDIDDDWYITGYMLERVPNSKLREALYGR